MLQLPKVISENDQRKINTINNFGYFENNYNTIVQGKNEFKEKDNLNENKDKNISNSKQFHNRVNLNFFI